MRSGENKDETEMRERSWDEHKQKPNEINPKQVDEMKQNASEERTSSEYWSSENRDECELSERSWPEANETPIKQNLAMQKQKEKGSSESWYHNWSHKVS